VRSGDYRDERREVRPQGPGGRAHMEDEAQRREQELARPVERVPAREGTRSVRILRRVWQCTRRHIRAARTGRSLQ